MPTHTYAILEVPQSAYDGVAAALERADPFQAKSRRMVDGLDMAGIAIRAIPERSLPNAVGTLMASLPSAAKPKIDDLVDAFVREAQTVDEAGRTRALQALTELSKLGFASARAYFAQAFPNATVPGE